MVTIESLITDERTARIVLASVAEPDDAFTGRLVARRGAIETVRLIGSADPVRGADVAQASLWRERLVPRLDAGMIRRTLAETERLGLRVLIPEDPDWPKGLGKLRERAPLALWVKGDPGILRQVRLREAVTFTGARAATSYGENVAQSLANDVADKGGVVVSGGAYGIDGAAHRAALASAGRTVAVLAGGLDRPYPAGHSDLLQRIGREGLLVSELPPGSAPTRWRFLARNRMLAAVSAATVVVEAGYRSGSLHVAAQAAGLGRPVGAVPGPVTSAASAGCHRLLREGIAQVITDAADLRALTVPTPVPARAEVSRATPTRARPGRSGLSR